MTFFSNNLPARVYGQRTYIPADDGGKVSGKKEQVVALKWHECVIMNVVRSARPSFVIRTQFV